MRNKKGLTLIELMVAVSITALVVTGSLLSFVQLMILADASANLTIAVNDAQFVLEQLKVTPFNSISSYVVPETVNFPGVPNVPVLHNLPEETITLTRNVVGDLATISVDVSWKEKGQIYPIHYVLSTCINK